MDPLNRLLSCHDHTTTEGSKGVRDGRAGEDHDRVGRGRLGGGEDARRPGTHGPTDGADGSAAGAPEVASHAGAWAMRGLGSKRLRGSIWWIRYWHRGKEYAESTHSTDPRMANKLLKKRLGQRESGKFHGTAQERVTYEQLKDYIIADYKKRDLRSLTTVDARFVHLDAAFAGMRAVDITPAHLHQYQAARRAAGAQAATVNRELAALRRM